MPRLALRAVFLAPVPLVLLAGFGCHQGAATRRIAAAPVGTSGSAPIASPPRASTVEAERDSGPSPEPRIVGLRVGHHHTCVALARGQAKCWGQNDAGELGIVSSAKYIGNLNDMGSNLAPMCLSPEDKPTDFAIGVDTICVLLRDGSVKCFGSGRHGERGTGDRQRSLCPSGDTEGNIVAVDLGTGVKAAAVTAGRQHFCALTRESRVKCWGSNGRGELGLGDHNSRGDEPGEMGDNLPYVDLGANREVRAIAAGSGFTCALLDNGRVKCWGYGQYLGIGIANDWGGAPGEMGDNLPPLDLGTGRTATTMSCSPIHCCAILDTGGLKCWGANGPWTASFNEEHMVGDSLDKYMVGDGPGEMGDALPTVPLGTGRKARVVSTGMEETCAVLDDNNLKCWGRNMDGSLGLGDTRERGYTLEDMGDGLPPVDLGLHRTPRLLAVGYNYVCVVLDDDELKCWGRRSSFQLGLVDDYHQPGSTPDTVPAKLPSVDIGE